MKPHERAADLQARLHEVAQQAIPSARGLTAVITTRAQRRQRQRTATWGLLLLLLISGTLGGFLLPPAAPVTSIHAPAQQSAPATPVGPPVAVGTARSVDPAAASPPPLPVQTGGPAALATGQAAVTAMAAAGTVFPPVTPIPGLAATAVARATAAPFPTAGPTTLQPGSPASATTRRGNLALELHLPGDAYLAGENGQALVTVRNDTGEPLFVVDMRLTAQDDGGQPLGLWPAGLQARDGWPGDRGPFDLMRLLAPGGSISQTVPFQLPPPDQATGHRYTVQASARYSRPDLQHPDRPDGVPADIATAPIPLDLTAPRPEQYLRAAITADRQGYRITVSAADGRPAALQGPAWGAIEATSGGNSQAGPLPPSTAGTWSATWGDGLGQGGRPLHVAGWVAARGYIPAVISTTVAGSNGIEDLGWVDSDAIGVSLQTFSSLPAAQVAAGISLTVPGPLPPGATLQRVAVQPFGGHGAYVWQYYRLPAVPPADAGWLLFTQREEHGVTGPASDLVGWGVARRAPGARLITVAGAGAGGADAPGYLVERDGWRVLTWKPRADAGFELAALAARFTSADLLALAAAAAPLR